MRSISAAIICSAVMSLAGSDALTGTPAAPSSCTFDGEALKAANSAVLEWSSDYVGQNWLSRSKYFILTAVDSISVPTDPNALPFTATDVALVSNTLCAFGYTPVGGDGDLAILSGTTATRDRLASAIAALKGVAEDEDPLLVLYYSGHAVTDGGSTSDLYLQLAEQTQVSASHGTALSDVVRRVRAVYKGELVIVLDACYSGTAAVSDVLSTPVFAGVTIITSSADTQFSYPLKIGDREMSAFSHAVVDGLTRDISTLDEDRDGIVWADDLAQYATVVLSQLADERRIPRKMTPYMTVLRKKLMVAYQRTNLSNPNSLPRRYFIAVSVRGPAGGARTAIANVFRSIAGMDKVAAIGSVRIEVQDVAAKEFLANIDLKSQAPNPSGQYETVVRLPMAVSSTADGTIVETTAQPVLNFIVMDEKGNPIGAQSVDIRSLPTAPGAEAIDIGSSTAKVSGASISVSAIK